MSKEKQIKELASILYLNKSAFDDSLMLEVAEALYNAGYRKQEWISVEDDKPKNSSERVQVFLRDSNFTAHIGSPKIDTDRYIDGKWVRWRGYVTHWMPLPEPPKGE